METTHRPVMDARAARIAEAIDRDEPLAQFEDIFPWTVSDPLTSRQVLMALHAWAGLGESRETDDGYAYLVEGNGTWWTVSVNDNMHLESVDEHASRDLAEHFYLATLCEGSEDLIDVGDEHLSVWVCPVCPVEGCGYVGELTTEERHAYGELGDHLKEAHHLRAVVKP